MNHLIVGERQLLKIRLRCISAQQNGVRLRQVSSNCLYFVAAFRQRNQFAAAQAGYCPLDRGKECCWGSFEYPCCNTEEGLLSVSRDIVPMPQKV